LKGRGWGFALVGLGASLLLAVLVSPFASSSPDGLERVAEDKGFISRAEEGEPAWNSSPVPDYTVPGVESESVATGLAGLVGTLGVFLVTLGIGVLIKKKGAKPGEGV